jgi:hypothetical protein
VHVVLRKTPALHKKRLLVEEQCALEDKKQLERHKKRRLADREPLLDDNEPQSLDKQRLSHRKR